MTEKHSVVQHVTLSLTGGYKFVASFEDLPVPTEILLDEAPPLGQASGPNAAALLSAAVGNCLAASLLFCLRKSRADVHTLTARVTTKIVRNDAGRFRIAGINVELSPLIEQGDRDRLVRCEDLYEDFCLVTESVRKGIPVNVTLKEAHGASS